MLGLTIPDAIAFGSLCAALLAAFAGMLRGERARPGRDAMDRRDESAAELRDTLGDLAGAIGDLAAAIRSATSAEESRDQYSAVIQGLMRRLEDRWPNNNR